MIDIRGMNIIWKFYLVAIGVACLLVVIGEGQFATVVVLSAVMLPAIDFVVGKIIKYKVVDEEIVIVAFGYRVLQRIDARDIVMVDTARFFIDIGAYKQEYQRTRFYRTSLFNKRKLLRLKSGRTVSITPDPGSAVDVFLSKIKSR